MILFKDSKIFIHPIKNNVTGFKTIQLKKSHRQINNHIFKHGIYYRALLKLHNLIMMSNMNLIHHKPLIHPMYLFEFRIIEIMNLLVL